MTARERKPNHGATNLTARSERGSIIKSEFYRSWTHKLISPDVHQSTSAPVDTDHVYKKSATWRPVDLVERNFTTTHSSSYLNPKDQTPLPDHRERSEEELAHERQVKEDQIEAVNALCKTAKAHFGTTASMMKVVSVGLIYILPTFAAPELKLYYTVNAIYLTVQQEK